MSLLDLLLMCLVLGCTTAAPAADDAAKTAAVAGNSQDALKTEASSSFARRYTDYPSGYGGYGVTGYGLIDDKYSGYSGYNGYNSPGYGGYSGNNVGYTSNNVGYSSNNVGYSGYNRGYGNNYAGYSGYGGYGGYGGNGGLSSYYGYNNPGYQGRNHLGYGYYGSGRGYGGNIYNNGIAPSLVTGYRGYSRR